MHKSQKSASSEVDKIPRVTSTDSETAMAASIEVTSRFYTEIPLMRTDSRRGGMHNHCTDKCQPWVQEDRTPALVTQTELTHLKAWLSEPLWLFLF